MGTNRVDLSIEGDKVTFLAPSISGAVLLEERGESDFSLLSTSSTQSSKF